MARENRNIPVSVGQEFYVVHERVVFAYEAFYRYFKSVFFGGKFSITETVSRLPFIGLDVAGDNRRIPHFARRLIGNVYEKPVYVYGQIIKIIPAYTPYFGGLIPTEIAARM